MSGLISKVKGLFKGVLVTALFKIALFGNGCYLPEVYLEAVKRNSVKPIEISEENKRIISKNKTLQGLIKDMEAACFEFYDAYKIKEEGLPQLVIMGEVHTMNTSKIASAIERFAPKNGYVCIENSRDIDKYNYKKFKTDAFVYRYILPKRSDLKFTGVDTDKSEGIKCCDSIAKLDISYQIIQKLYKEEKLNKIDKWMVNYLDFQENDDLDEQLIKYHQAQCQKLNESAGNRDYSIILNILYATEKRKKIPGFVVLGGSHVDNESNRETYDDLLLQTLRTAGISYVSFIFSRTKIKESYKSEKEKIKEIKKEEKKEIKKKVMKNIKKGYTEREKEKKKTEIKKTPEKTEEKKENKLNYEETFEYRTYMYSGGFLSWFYNKNLKKVNCPFTEEKFISNYLYCESAN